MNTSRRHIASHVPDSMDDFLCGWTKHFLLVFISIVAWEMEGHLNSKKERGSVVARQGIQTPRDGMVSEERWNILLKWRRKKVQESRIPGTKGCESMPQMKWEEVVASSHQQSFLCEMLYWMLENATSQFQSLQMLISMISIKTVFDLPTAKWGKHSKTGIMSPERKLWFGMLKWGSLGW